MNEHGAARRTARSAPSGIGDITDERVIQLEGGSSMDGQMDIFSFIEPKPKEDKPKHPRVWNLKETEPDYLGVVSPDHAEVVKGRQMKFCRVGEHDRQAHPLPVAVLAAYA